MSDSMQGREQLQPCPFCGGTRIKIQSNGIGDFYAICQADDDSELDCGARASDRSCETREYAADRWNTRTEAEAARAEERWQPIETLPPNPVQVEFFYSKLMMRDQNENPVSPIIEPYRDERRQLGYFDGDTWCHCGTGHRVFEFHDTPLEDLPTHWRALPAPPCKAQPVALGEGEG